LNNPISRGFIEDWEDIEKVWHYSIYEELSVIPEQTNVLMTEPPLNRKENREKMTEIMFETFNVNRFYVKSTSCLSLISNGVTRGLVVESGEQLTSCVPVFEA